MWGEMWGGRFETPQEPQKTGKNDGDPSGI